MSSELDDLQALTEEADPDLQSDEPAGEAGGDEPPQRREEHTLSSGDESDPEADEADAESAAAAAAADDADADPGDPGAGDDSAETDATGQATSEDADAEGEAVQYVVEDVDEVPEEWKDFKYVGTNTAYRDDEAILQGMEEKDKHIQRQNEEIERLRQDAGKQVRELRQRLSLYEDRMPEEELREAMVDEQLPEKYRGKTRDDFLDEDERNEFIIARHEAEKAVQRQLEERREKEEAEQDELEKRVREASDLVTELFDPGEFGLESTEDEALLQEVMAENAPEEGESVVRLATKSTAAMGDPRVAQLMRDGIRFRLAQKRGERAGVRRVDRTTERETTDDAPPPTKKRDYSQMSGKEMTEDALQEMGVI